MSISFLLLLEFFNSINIRFVQMTLTEAKLDNSILYEIVNFINQMHNWLRNISKNKRLIPTNLFITGNNINN